MRYLFVNPDLDKVSNQAFGYKHKHKNCIYVVTSQFETMYFHTFIDSDGDSLDTIFFPQIAKYNNVTGKGVYSMKGKLVEVFSVYSIEVNYCKKIGIKSRADKAN